MKRRLAFVVLATILLAGCSGGAKKVAPAADTPAATAAATAAPVPTPSPLVNQFSVRASPGAFVRLSYAPGEVIDAKRGVFFMDTGTGAVEGWQLSDSAILADGGEPANCCIGARVSDDNRFITLRGQKTAWLFDRKAGKAVSWEAARMALVAMSPHYLLFELAIGPGLDPNPEFDGHYTVVDENLAPVSTFKLERGGRGSPPVLFSPDEHRLIIPAGNKSWSDYTSFAQVDTVTGTVRNLADFPAVPPGYSPHVPKFAILEGGSEFVVTLAYGPDGTGDLPYRTVVRRYTWSGSLVAEFELPAPGVSFAPDGKLLAYEQIQRYVLGGPDGPIDSWSNVVVADGRTGSPLLRVRSASLGYGDGLGDTRWLADSTGITVAVRPRLPLALDVSRWNYRAFSLLIPNEGRLQPLDLAENDLLGPIPAPDRPGLFAVGHIGTRELGTGRRLSANSAEPWFDHVPPWGTTSTELRFALPHGGHGGGSRNMVLPPRIEYPPFDDRLAFHVAGTGSCLNLRSQPSRAAGIAACLPDGAVVILSDPPEGPPFGKLATGFADETLWVHVRTASGDEGWVSSGYLQW